MTITPFGRRGFMLGASLLAGGLLMHASADAELLAYEGFDYDRAQWFTGGTHSEGIVGFDGGTGWAGGWQDSGSSRIENGETYDVRGGIADVNSPDDFIDAGARIAPLGYTDSVGNTLATTGNQYRGAFGNFNREYRALDTTLGETGASVWFSFVAQAHGLSSSYTRVGLGTGDTGFAVYFGKIHNQTTWSIQAPNVVSDIPADEAVMYLARIDFNDWNSGESDVVSVWLNPDRLDAAPVDAPTLVLDALTDDLVIDTLVLHGRYSTDYDEFRIGTTFDSVTPYVAVPEPATVGLVGLGLAMMAGRRRK